MPLLNRFRFQSIQLQEQSTMNIRPFVLVPFVALFGLVNTAQARSDAAFMKQAAQNGAAEIQAGEIAATKAVTPAVKDFAKTMVTDHAKVADELKALAASKNVELPSEPSMKQKADLKLVDAAAGRGFDVRYAKTFGVKAHKDTVKLFETAAKSATDPDVKAWAAKTLPGLQHHLEMANALPSSGK
jgi:putative membrane protein